MLKPVSPATGVSQNRFCDDGRKDSDHEKTRQQEEVEAFFQHHFHHDDQNNTFKRAHCTFEKVHEFEQQLEAILPLIEQHLQADTNADASNTVIWHQVRRFWGWQPLKSDIRRYSSVACEPLAN